jgi:hypothetical protein
MTTSLTYAGSSLRGARPHRRGLLARGHRGDAHEGDSAMGRRRPAGHKYAREHAAEVDELAR